MLHTLFTVLVVLGSLLLVWVLLAAWVVFFYPEYETVERPGW